MGLKKSLIFVLALTIFTYFIPSPVLAQSPTIESFSSTGTIAGGGTTLSINLPSGVQSGDLLVACVAASGSDTSDISATDWTHVTSQDFLSFFILLLGHQTQ